MGVGRDEEVGEGRPEVDILGERDLEDAGRELEAYKAPLATPAPNSLLVLVGNSCDLDR